MSTLEEAANKYADAVIERETRAFEEWYEATLAAKFADFPETSRNIMKGAAQMGWIGRVTKEARNA